MNSQGLKRLQQSKIKQTIEAKADQKGRKTTKTKKENIKVVLGKKIEDEVIGHSKRIKNIIGSFKSTTSISYASR